MTRARASLESLRRHEVVLQREVSQFASAREFLFKHALLRDVAYDGVLRAHRERYHRRAAAWLAETSAAVGRADEYAADIADHYDRAHDPAASLWYLRAGTRAASVYALTEATRMLDSALKHAPEGDPHLRFDILLAQEDLLDRRGEREPQQRALDAMAALADHLDPPRQVQLELAQSRFQFSHSEYDTARLHADRAVEIATEIDDLALRAEATLAQGKALTWAAEGEGAHVCLTRAVELAREIGRPALIGEGLRYLSMLASNNGDFPASLEYAAEAREVFARAGDTELESTALAQGANTYFNLGRYAEAQAALEETLPIFRRSGHRYRETINLGNLASIALMRGQLASAEQWGREAVENAHQLEELEAEANYLLVLGAVATLTSRFDVARSHLDDAISIAHEVHEDALQGETLARMSTVELATGNLDEALALGAKGGRRRRRRRLRARPRHHPAGARACRRGDGSVGRGRDGLRRGPPPVRDPRAGLAGPRDDRRARQCRGRSRPGGRGRRADRAGAGAPGHGRPGADLGARRDAALLPPDPRRGG